MNAMQCHPLLLRAIRASKSCKAKPERPKIGVSPLADPLVAALFAHHPAHAPERFSDRLLPILVSAPEQPEKRDAVEAHVASPPIAADISYAVKRAYPLVDDIIAVVARHYEVTVSDILSSRRSWDVIRPRHIAFWLAKNLTPRSLPSIGRSFGGRDHTTILSGVRKIEAHRKEDEELASELEYLKLRIMERMARRNAAHEAVAA